MYLLKNVKCIVELLLQDEKSMYIKLSLVGERLWWVDWLQGRKQMVVTDSLYSINKRYPDRLDKLSNIHN